MAKNIQEYVANEVIKYLKDRDEEIKNYKNMLLEIKDDGAYICKGYNADTDCKIIINPFDEDDEYYKCAVCSFAVCENCSNHLIPITIRNTTYICCKKCHIKLSKPLNNI